MMPAVPILIISDVVIAEIDRKVPRHFRFLILPLLISLIMIVLFTAFEGRSAAFHFGREFYNK